MAEIACCVGVGKFVCLLDCLFTSLSANCHLVIQRIGMSSRSQTKIFIIYYSKNKAFENFVKLKKAPPVPQGIHGATKAKFDVSFLF